MQPQESLERDRTPGSPVAESTAVVRRVSCLQSRQLHCPRGGGGEAAPDRHHGVTAPEMLPDTPLSLLPRSSCHWWRLGLWEGLEPAQERRGAFSANPCSCKVKQYGQHGAESYSKGRVPGGWGLGGLCHLWSASPAGSGLLRPCEALSGQMERGPGE